MKAIIWNSDNTFITAEIFRDTPEMIKKYNAVLVTDDDLVKPHYEIKLAYQQDEYVFDGDWIGHSNSDPDGVYLIMTPRSYRGNELYKLVTLPDTLAYWVSRAKHSNYQLFEFIKLHTNVAAPTTTYESDKLKDMSYFDYPEYQIKFVEGWIHGFKYKDNTEGVDIDVSKIKEL